MKKLVFILAATAALTSCTKSEIINYPGPEGEGAPIQAQSNHDGVTASVTRKPFEGAISSGNTLTAKVLTYQADNTLWSDGTMIFTDQTNAVEYENGATKTKFGADKTEVYTMHGLYPSSGWGTTPANQSSGTMAYTFDGKTDVMAAKATTTPGAATPPKLEFKHLLTKLIVKIKAADAESDTEWTTLTNIQLLKIEGDANKVFKTLTYNLSNGNTSFSTAASPMNFYQMSGTDAYTDILRSATAANITTAEATVAYCLINPVNIAIADNITLKVTATSASGSRDIEVPASLTIGANGSSQGYAYTITLTFDMNEIKASATIAPWGTGNNPEAVVV